ncbi:MAG: hypothetical protein EOP85_21800, partial [Verrucomicrobiaceae bacterium]
MAQPPQRSALAGGAGGRAGDYLGFPNPSSSFSPRAVIMSRPAVILQEVSPYRNLEAILEQDRRAAHLYLHAPENEGFGLKSCWVRNLAKAPPALDVAGMRNGESPMLPRGFCAFPNGQPPLDAARLSLLWLPEGDGVVLLEDGEMLAAIPPWSGMKGFHGYARDCIGEGPLCWRLEDPSDFDHRISEAKWFWETWDRPDHPWDVSQPRFLEAYEREFGRHQRYFAIDGDQWPPKALARFKTGDDTVLLTLGVSLVPQPSVEMHFQDPENHRRIELAACFAPEASEEVVAWFTGWLAAQSGLPWANLTFLANGHTIPCHPFPADQSLPPFQAVLFLENPPGAPQPVLPTIEGDKVTLLWAIPI